MNLWTIKTKIKLNNFDKALEYAMKAIRINPDNEQYRNVIRKIKQKIYFI